MTLDRHNHTYSLQNDKLYFNCNKCNEMVTYIDLKPAFKLLEQHEALTKGTDMHCKDKKAKNLLLRRLNK